MSIRAWLERKAEAKAEDIALGKLADAIDSPEKRDALATRLTEGSMSDKTKARLEGLLWALAGGFFGALTPFLADPSKLDLSTAALGLYWKAGLAGALLSLFAYLRPNPAAQKAGLLVLALLLSTGAYAQDVPVVPAPEPLPLWTATLDSGTSAVLTRGEKREFVTARVGFAARLSDVFGAFARLDVAGDQDGGGLNLTDPHTFRSIDAAGGFRRITGPLRLSILGGVTYSIEGDQDKPIDARLFTLAGLVGRVVGEGGYVEVGAGHHGPVGGPALLASAQIPVSSGAFTVIDLAFPLQRNVLSEKAWVLKIGASVRVKQLHGGRSGPAPVAPAVKPASAGELVQPDPAAVPEGNLLAEKHGAR